MDSGTGDRGVSEVMGFILVFGMLVLSFTVYQGIVVPDQNRQVEFEHNQAVQGQFQDLRNAIVSTAATGSGRAVSVTLGASYPTRAIAQNLGISGGSIQTTDESSIQIHNAEALDGEARDYLDGSQRAFETKSIRYTPVYSFYSGAPETMYENTVAYNQFGDTNLTLTDQVLVDGRRITLVALNGSLSKAQRDTVSISTEAISASSNRVAVRNSTGGQVNITVPTRLSATDWEVALEDEMGSSGYVEGVHAIPGEAAVNISMKQGVTYELRMAKIGVGDTTTEEEAKYITSVEGNGSSVPEGGTGKIVVEVRDRFNNPVSNVSVEPDVTRVSPNPQSTDEEGRATFTYTAPGSGPTQDTFNLSFEGGGTENKSVTFEISVLDTDGSASGGGGGDGGGDTEDINPGAPGTITLDSVGTVANSGQQLVEFTLKNDTSESDTVEMTDARISFYFKGTSHTTPTWADINSANINNPTRLNINDDFKPLDEDIPLNPSTTTISLDFNHDVEHEDFYVVSLKFEMPDGSVDTYTYFVSHPR